MSSKLNADTASGGSRSAAQMDRTMSTGRLRWLMPDMISRYELCLGSQMGQLGAAQAFTRNLALRSRSSGHFRVFLPMRGRLELARVLVRCAL